MNASWRCEWWRLVNVSWTIICFCIPQNSYSLPTPARVIFLRILAFLFCAFLVAVALCSSQDANSSVGQSTPPTLSGGVAPPKQAQVNESASEQSGDAGIWPVGQVWSEMLDMLPEEMLEKAKQLWQNGSDHQTAVASMGLLTCLTGVLMAGPVRCVFVFLKPMGLYACVCFSFKFHFGVQIYF